VFILIILGSCDFHLTVEIEMELFVVKRWIKVQLNSARSCTVTIKRDARTDVENRSWVLDAVYEELANMI